jgi:phosphoglycolate phosphatase-like HAD superfamily hydrolase
MTDTTDTREWVIFDLDGTLFDYTGIITANIYMRAKGDYRPDYEIKKEVLFKLFPTPQDRSKILGVFEDRDQVVKMYRDLGLRVFQVAEGNF